MAVREGLVSEAKAAGAGRREGYPALTPAFTWAALALGVWVLLGAIVDIHAHNHGQVDETFFTPFHLLMYSGVAANGLFYVVMQYRYVARGHRLLQALPRAYLLSFGGVLLFGVGGVFDLIWHSLFGFEAGIDALVSPAHLLLALSGLLFMSGPLRSFLAQGATGRGWKILFPPLTAALMALTLATLFTGFNNVWSQVDRYVAIDPADDSRRLAEAYTVATVLIPAALMTGALLFLRRRMALPFGAVTFLLFANALVMFFIRLEDTATYAPVLLAPLLAGLAGDWLLARESGSPLLALRLFAFVVPFILTFGLFVILLLGAGIWWSTHMWVGVSFMAGAVGLALAGLVRAEELPQPS